MTKGGQSTSSDTMLAMVKNFPCTCSDFEYADAASFPLLPALATAPTPPPPCAAGAAAGAGAGSLAGAVFDAGVLRGVFSALGLRAEGGGVSASGIWTPVLLARDRVRGPSPLMRKASSCGILCLPLQERAVPQDRTDTGRGGL